LLLLSVAARKFRNREARPLLPWQVIGMTILGLSIIAGLKWGGSDGWRDLYAQTWLWSTYLYLGVLWSSGLRNPPPRVRKRDPILRLPADGHWHLLLAYMLICFFLVWRFHLSGYYLTNPSMETLLKAFIVMGVPAVGAFGLERWLSVWCRRRRSVVAGLFIAFLAIMAVLSLLGFLVLGMYGHQLGATTRRASDLASLPLIVHGFLLVGRISPFFVLGRLLNPNDSLRYLWGEYVWVQNVSFHVAVGLVMYLIYRYRRHHRSTE
jgi:hypothetical protein